MIYKKQVLQSKEAEILTRIATLSLKLAPVPGKSKKHRIYHHLTPQCLSLREEGPTTRLTLSCRPYSRHGWWALWLQTRDKRERQVSGGCRACPPTHLQNGVRFTPSPRSESVPVTWVCSQCFRGGRSNKNPSLVSSSHEWCSQW